MLWLSILQTIANLILNTIQWISCFYSCFTDKENGGLEKLEHTSGVSELIRWELEFEPMCVALEAFFFNLWATVSAPIVSFNYLLPEFSPHTCQKSL